MGLHNEMICLTPTQLRDILVDGCTRVTLIDDLMERAAIESMQNSCYPLQKKILADEKKIS